MYVKYDNEILHRQWGSYWSLPQAPQSPRSMIPPTRPALSPDDVRVWKSESVKVWKGESVKEWKCERVKVWKRKDRVNLKIYLCESVLYLERKCL